MLTFSDVEQLRKQGMGNREIMQTMARVVPSAAKALHDADMDRNTPDSAKDGIFAKMIDAGVPRTGISGLPYVNAVSVNAAQKKFDTLQADYAKVEGGGTDPGINHTPGRYQAPEEGIGFHNIIQTFGKVGFNIGKDAWDFAGALLTDPGNTVKGMINPIVGAAQAGVDALVPGQIFGDTEAKDSAYHLAAAYGLPQVIEGISHLVKGQGRIGLGEIDKGISQAYVTAYENPLSTYLLGKGAKDLLGGAVKGAGSIAEKGVAGMTSGADAVPINSVAGKIGKGASVMQDVGQQIRDFGPEAMVAGVRGKIPETIRAPLEKGAMGAMDAVMKAPGAAMQGGKAVGQYAAAQFSGLSPETMRSIAQNPDRFSKAQQGDITVGTVASELKHNIETRLSELSENGKLYNAIRESKKTVDLPQGGFEGILNKWGLKFEKGEIVVDPETAKMHLEGGDIAGLQKFMSDYGREGKASSNRILNARQALDQLAGWGENKTEASTLIARDLRTYIDSHAKKLPGLEAIDKMYGPERQLLNKVRDQFLHKEMTPDGKTVYMLNDNALRKLYSSTTALNDPMMKRVEQLVPGITKDLRVIRALKDVELANGQKVGTYLRGAVGGGGLITGNVPAVVAAVIFSPPVLVPLLKWWGKVTNKSSMSTNILTKIRAGSPLTDAQKQAISEAMNMYEVEAKKASAPADVLPVQESLPLKP